MASPRRQPMEPAPRNSAIAPAMRGGLILLAAVLIGILLIWADDDGPSAGSPVAAPDTTVPLSVPVTELVTTTLPTRDFKTVAVLVANGSTVNGAARRLQSFLIPTYNVLEPIDAKTKPQPSAIFARPGFDDVVADLNTRLGTSLTMLPLDDTVPVAATEAARAQVVLIVGADLAEKFRNQQAATTSAGATAGATAGAATAADAGATASGATAVDTGAATAVTVGPA
jgi:hypothetical protein